MTANTSRVVSIAAALTWLVAAPARADVFISPNIGVATGGVVQDGTKLTFGGQLGVMSEGMFGFEGDYGYTAKIRGGNGHDNIRTLSASLLLGFGGTKQFRPYASVGGGVVGTVSEVKHIFAPSDDVESKGVVSAGGGFFAYFSDRLGIRVDARYFRILANPEEEGFDVSPHFIRAQGGVVFRF